MSELTIRRNRGFSTVQPQKTEKTEKQAASGQSQKTARSSGDVVSETMRKLMANGSRAASSTRESRRTLQTGEAVLAEVQDSLSRMAKLAKEAENGGTASYAALQEEMEQLQGELERIVTSAAAGGVQLFLTGDAGNASGAEALPTWLMQGLAQNTPTAAQLLAALGLDKTASGSEILAAIANSSLEGSSAAGYLAAMYLGSVIAGSASGTIDPSQAVDGLRQLMEKIADGTSPDQAVQELTGGEFSSLADFEAQFTEGIAPGMQSFLLDYLLADGEAALVGMPPLMALLAGMQGANMDLLMDILSAAVSQSMEEALDTAAPDVMNRTAGAEAPPAPVTAAQMGDLRVMGRDLSEVSFNAETGELTIGGTENVMVLGTGQSEQAIVLTGSGTVTLQNVQAPVLTVQTAEAQIFSAGENTLAQVQMQEGASLTISGNGLLHIGSLRGDETNLLRLTGGAVAIEEENGRNPGRLAIPVVLDGPASLAAQAATVRDTGGKTLEPFDLIWKALLPGFAAITSVEVDGRQAKMALLNDTNSAFARLWMEKGDLSAHGNPIHALTVRGRDKFGQTQTRYAYLVWNQQAGKFREMSMYPNPFVVTGGEQDQDWIYEEESHTLHILSAQVTAVSGGSGTGANQEPFSGRIALADGIGTMTLTLGGVSCRVSSGRAFYLGRENDVTLILSGGTANLFESGEGCAGISLGDGTSLRIECAGSSDEGDAAGTLTATGGTGGVGIGRDSGRIRDMTGRILIHGGMITGTEKPGETGSVTIVGGTSASGTGTVDMGTARLWARMGVFLQVGEDTVILPQFHLSSRAMRLDRLRVSSKEAARAALATIEAERREVSRVQSSYSSLYRQMERGFNVLLDSTAPDIPVRDNGAADALLKDMRPFLSSRAVRASGRPGDDVEHLLR